MSEDTRTDAIKITVDDGHGDVETATISNDYVLICAGNRYLANVQTHANGTVVLTVKVGEEP